MSETSSPGARLRTGAHAFWRQHCTLLLRDAGLPSPELRSELLLAGLAAEQAAHWLQDSGRPAQQLAAELVAVVTGTSLDER